MQIPKRRAQLLQIREEEGPVFVTPQTLQRLIDQLTALKNTERPKVVEDLSFARQKGDLSENAEYQDARLKLSRIDGRIFSLTEKIKNASIITKGPSTDGRIQIGTTVILSTNKIKKTYTILGSQESNPSKGLISHLSPLGRALLGKMPQEQITIQTPNGNATYTIEEIK